MSVDRGGLAYNISTDYDGASLDAFKSDLATLRAEMVKMRRSMGRSMFGGAAVDAKVISDALAKLVKATSQQTQQTNTQASAQDRLTRLRQKYLNLNKDTNTRGQDAQIRNLERGIRFYERILQIQQLEQALYSAKAKAVIDQVNRLRELVSLREKSAMLQDADVRNARREYEVARQIAAIEDRNIVDADPKLKSLRDQRQAQEALQASQDRHANRLRSVQENLAALADRTLRTEQVKLNIARQVANLEDKKIVDADPDLKRLRQEAEVARQAQAAAQRQADILRRVAQAQADLANKPLRDAQQQLSIAKQLAKIEDRRAELNDPALAAARKLQAAEERIAKAQERITIAKDASFQKNLTAAEIAERIARSERELAKLRDENLERVKATLTAEEKIARYKREQATLARLASFARSEGLAGNAEQLKKLGIGQLDAERLGLLRKQNTALEAFAKATRAAGFASREAEPHVNRLGFTFRRLFGVLALFTAARQSFRAFREVVAESVRFNARIETAQLGIASLFTAVGDVRDAMGETVDRSRALALAQGEARRQINLLRRDAIDTKATFDELVETFQIAVGPGLSAGLDIDEIRKFTVSISQAAGAIGLPQNQLQEEIRSIFTGSIQLRTTRIAAVLGITNEDIRRAKEAGTLMEFLEDRFAAFTVAGKESLNTFDGLIARVRDGFSLLMGTSGESLFVEIKKSLKDLFSAFTDQDSITGLITPDPQALETMRLIFGVLTQIVEASVRFVSSFNADTIVEFVKALSVGVVTAMRFAISFVQSFLASFNAAVGVVRKIVSLLAKIPVIGDLFDFDSLDDAAQTLGTLFGGLVAIKSVLFVISATISLILLPLSAILGVVRSLVTSVHLLATAMNVVKVSAIATNKAFLGSAVVQRLTAALSQFKKGKYQFALLSLKDAATAGAASFGAMALSSTILVTALATVVATVIVAIQTIRKMNVEGQSFGQAWTNSSYEVARAFDSLVDDSLGRFLRYLGVIEGKLSAIAAILPNITVATLDTAELQEALGELNQLRLKAEQEAGLAEGGTAEEIEYQFSTDNAEAKIEKVRRLLDVIRQENATAQKLIDIPEEEVSKVEKIFTAMANISGLGANGQKFIDPAPEAEKNANTILEANLKREEALKRVLEKLEEAALVASIEEAVDFAAAIKEIPGVITQANAGLQDQENLLKELVDQSLEVRDALSIGFETLGLGESAAIVKEQITARLQAGKKTEQIVKAEAETVKKITEAYQKQADISIRVSNLKEGDEAVFRKLLDLTQQISEAEDVASRAAVEAGAAQQRTLRLRETQNREQIDAAEQDEALARREAAAARAAVDALLEKARALNGTAKDSQLIAALLEQQVVANGQLRAAQDDQASLAGQRLQVEDKINATLTNRLTLLAAEAIAQRDLLKLAEDVDRQQIQKVLDDPRLNRQQKEKLVLQGELAVREALLRVAQDTALQEVERLEASRDRTIGEQNRLSDQIRLLQQAEAAQARLAAAQKAVADTKTAQKVVPPQLETERFFDARLSGQLADLERAEDSLDQINRLLDREGLTQTELNELYQRRLDTTQSIELQQANINSLAQQYTLENQLALEELEKINRELALIETRRRNPVNEGVEEGLRQARDELPTLFESTRDLTAGLVLDIAPTITQTFQDAVRAGFDPESGILDVLQQALGNMLLDLSSQIMQAVLNQIVMNALTAMLGQSSATLTASAALNVSAFKLTAASTSLATVAAPALTGSAAALAASARLLAATNIGGGIVGGSLFEGGNVGEAFSKARGYARGGIPNRPAPRSVRPAGLHPRDTVPIWADPREWIINAGVVKSLGDDFMAAFNAGRIDPMALKALAGVSSGARRRASAAPRARRHALGFAEGGRVATAGSAGSTGAGTLPQVVAAFPASEKTMRSLLSDDRGALMDWLRDNRSEVNATLG
jgi:hypothetical protein